MENFGVTIFFVFVGMTGDEGDTVDGVVVWVLNKDRSQLTIEFHSASSFVKIDMFIHASFLL